MLIKLRVNGSLHELDVQPAETLNLILRERLRLTGTKKGATRVDAVPAPSSSMEGRSIRA